jgi:hypothetical protein
MNPYLEEPEIWPSVHHALLAATREALVPLLRPRYFVLVELHEYEASPFALGLVGSGDVLIGSDRQARSEPNGHQVGGSDTVDAAAAQPEQGPGVLVVDLPRTRPALRATRRRLIRGDTGSQIDRWPAAGWSP